MGTKRWLLVGLVLGLLWPAVASGAAQDESWWDSLVSLAAKDEADSEEAAPATAPDAADGEKPHDRKGPPIPFHCIEGYSGGAITPMAYLCNGCACGCGGKCLTPPSVAYSFMDVGSKDLHTFSVTQSFLGRFEFGYAVNRMSIGSLDDDIKAAGMDPIRKHIYLHHLNLRANIIPENSFNLPIPAVTAGVHFKYNHDVDIYNHRLGHAFSSIGYKRPYGVDYTLVASKMFPELAFGRPIIVTGGIRFTQAAQLGLLGFGENYHAFFEGSVVYMPTDWLVLGYEFRQKESPYKTLGKLVGEEDNWHAFSLSWIVNKHLTVSALWGLTGHMVNAQCDKTLGLQVKWEF